jgi:LPPG:FO 2-phospho-L-lactate transferase
VHVSPDVDIVTYWLAGVADTTRGWGLSGDTFNVVDSLARLGEETWFRLGDADFGTCLHRTRMLDGGAALSEVTDDIGRALGVAATVLPMSDDPVRTRLRTSDGRDLDFQEYFVKERTEPEIVEIDYEGSGEAAPAPGVLDAISGAELVVVCPSNPMLSVEPILRVRGIRDALRKHPSVVAVTPIVKGAAVKGPADRLLAGLAGEASASRVARLYTDFCDTFVVDASDDTEVQRVRAAGVRAVGLDTLMTDRFASERLASDLLKVGRAP